MKIFFRRAPLLHLIKEGEEEEGDMRLFGITGDAMAQPFFDFWESNRITEG